MEISTYITIQQILMSAMVALGTHLIFANKPDQIKGSNIHNACRTIGVSMIILPLASFIYYFFDLGDLGYRYATAVNLTSYCLTSTIVTLAYYILLDQINDKIQLKIHLTIGLLYPFPLWFGLCCGSEFVVNHIVIVAYTLFCVIAITHISSIIYFYMQRCKKLKDSMSKLEELELNLIKRTIYVSIALIIISICSPSSSSYPVWLALLFVICFISGSLYIYICFYKILNSNINSLIKPEIEMTEEKIEPTPITINDKVMLNIEKNVQNWVDIKGFLQPNITINHVAKAVGTNRTYLSRYINTAYKNQFKNWITQLRIKEAKELMCREPKLSISEVALQTGFSSIESFSHIFTRYEQISPSKWREVNSRSNY